MRKQQPTNNTEKIIKRLIFIKGLIVIYQHFVYMILFGQNISSSFTYDKTIVQNI